MPDVTINYVSVLVAAIAMFIIGAIWYMPPVFGNAWMKALGKKKDDLGQPGPGMIGMAVSALISSYVLAHFIEYIGAMDWIAGALTGFWLWLGFVATTHIASVFFEGRSATVYYINMSYNLVNLLVAGAILAVWK